MSAKPVVLITGASSGIGAETARHFASKGFETVATMRMPKGASPTGVTELVLDVTDGASITAAVASVMERFGRIDVLVNNAGYGLIGPLESLTSDQLRRQFDTNVFGLVAMMRAVLPGMRTACSGTIVNVSSVGGRMAFPFTAAYHGTKFAVEGITESVRYELKPFGIRVKLVEPGGIRTDFGTRSMELVVEEPYEPMTHRMLKLYRERGNSLPGPEKVAATIFRAATDRGDQLRYPVHAQPFLGLNRVLPDALWRRMLGQLVGPQQPASAKQHE